MSTITIELCKEDRERLDIIISALREVLSGAKPEKPKAEEPKKVEAPKQEPKEEPKAVEAEKVEESKTEEVPWASVSVAELQSKVVQLVSAGKKEETRAIIMKYAKSVSEVAEDKRAEVLEELKKLEV